MPRTTATETPENDRKHGLALDRVWATPGRLYGAMPDSETRRKAFADALALCGSPYYWCDPYQMRTRAEIAFLVPFCKIDLGDLGFGYAQYEWHNLFGGRGPRIDWEALNLNPQELWFLINLPHGSGIDCDWRGKRMTTGSLRLSNSYHCMDENGYYRVWVDFTILVYADGHDFRILFHGHNRDATSRYWAERIDLRSYLEDTIAALFYAAFGN